MRIQSSHDFSARGLDAYWTCPEAIRSLIVLESGRIPRRIWEPAAGTGAIVMPLRDAGHIVTASDIFDYGFAGCIITRLSRHGPAARCRGRRDQPAISTARGVPSQSAVRSRLCRVSDAHELHHGGLLAACRS